MSRPGTDLTPAEPPGLPDLSGPWPGPGLADATHHLRRSLEPALRAARRSARPDPEAIEAVLRRALRLGTDDDLPALAAAYRRGEATRFDLYRSPAFAAAVRSLHGKSSTGPGVAPA